MSLSSVVLLQRTLIWILRALEVDAHAIRQNGQIPGCRAEGRTSTRDSCVLFDGNTPRSRGRADPIDATPDGGFWKFTVTASTTFLTRVDCGIFRIFITKNARRNISGKTLAYSKKKKAYS